MIASKRGVKRFRSAAYDVDVSIRRRVIVKLSTPTSIEECKQRLLSLHPNFVARHLLNRHKQIDPASLRNFIRKGNDMLQIYLELINVLGHSSDTLTDL